MKRFLAPTHVLAMAQHQESAACLKLKNSATDLCANLTVMMPKLGTSQKRSSCLMISEKIWRLDNGWVWLTYAPCNFGNKRPYFICPGVVDGRACGRRTGKLFSGGRYFLCRHCYNVAYTSQSEARYDRMLRRANKLRIELAGADEFCGQNWTVLNFGISSHIEKSCGGSDAVIR